jgi:L-serine dehydratase
MNNNKSIFNDVLGPVMRGPSSSHTAASFRIATICRSLLNGEPKNVCFLFDPKGSYGKVFRQQGSDLAFGAGTMGWDITDPRFCDVFSIAESEGRSIEFQIGEIPGSDHPNEVLVNMKDETGDEVEVLARSIGGGAIKLTRIDGQAVDISGDSYNLLIMVETEGKDSVLNCMKKHIQNNVSPVVNEHQGLIHFHLPLKHVPDKEFLNELISLPMVSYVRTTQPVLYVCSGTSLFSSAEELLTLSDERGCSLWEIALAYEAQLIGISSEEVIQEMYRRLEIMQKASEEGLETEPQGMKLLKPCAGDIFRAEKQGKLPVGGLHARAMARALGVMHVNGSKGVICAAPTAGSAGVIPGVILTLKEEMGLSREQLIRGLLTASAIGLIVAVRATFAAEVAGCQAEIGVAGAMASAAVVEMTGGTPEQALDAAGVFLQNNLGLICDPVQGFVEIPCHTRNGAAASNALVCADMIVGGYKDPIPFDETVDAMYSVGQMLPRELRCTALGGLSICPTACNLPHLNK